MSIILASASPRRKELLEMLGVKELKIVPARGEEIAPENAAPGELVEVLSLAKAREVEAKCRKDDVIIAADTVVVYEGRVYGKPHTKERAVEMLTELSGKYHQVYTGVTVIKDGAAHCKNEMTAVKFREMTQREIEAYVATGEPMDKAGSYGAQGKGALFVERIEGDFFNVMGLPLCMLGQILNELGVNIL